MTEQNLKSSQQANGFTIVLNLLGGLGGGIVGTLLLLLLFFLTSTTVRIPLEQGFASVPPVFVFMFMALVFVSSLTANTLGCLFIGLFDRSRYRHLTSGIVQIFVLNLLIFIILAPLYILVTRINPELLIFLAGLQVLLGAQASFLILEIVSDTTYALLGVYTSILSTLVATLVALLIFHVTDKNLTILLLGIFPLLWGFIGLFSGLFRLLYQIVSDLYGVDFLRSDTRYGRDMPYENQEGIGSVEEDERILLEETEEEGGTQFLRKKK